jgi:hypothetical protein
VSILCIATDRYILSVRRHLSRSIAVCTDSLAERGDRQTINTVCQRVSGVAHANFASYDLRA